MTKRVMCLSAIGLVLVGLAIAKDNRATIQGTVIDPQGGAVVNATGAVKNADTGVSVSLKFKDTVRAQEANR